jgi:glycosyltransferase involved in cell wall biosynthesis
MQKVNSLGAAREPEERASQRYAPPCESCEVLSVLRRDVSQPVAEADAIERPRLRNSAASINARSPRPTSGFSRECYLASCVEVYHELLQMQRLVIHAAMLQELSIMKNGTDLPEITKAHCHVTDVERPSRVFLSAFAVHFGGGLVLLKALVQGLGTSLEDALIDDRARHDVPVDPSMVRVRYVPRSLVARFIGLMALASRTRRGDVLFCFNSLPPLRKPLGRVVNYVHAPYIVGADPQVRYQWLSALRQWIERIWFRAGVANCDEVWVQTPTMAHAIRSAYPGIVVQVVPFVDDQLAEALRAHSSHRVPESQANYAAHSFFYPADGVAHKNHSNLLKAWALLAADGRFPQLLLTLRPDEMDAALLGASLRKNELPSVTNLGRLPRQRVLDQLSQSSALIFPSRAETLGLPLLEARALGVPILASERDFVRDVCEPAHSFDPNSPASIASAVQRFVQGRVPLTGKYFSAGELVRRLTGCAS